MRRLGEGMAKAALRIEPVETGGQLARFIDVSNLIHAGDPNYVPPLAFERRRHLSPAHNPYFQHAEAQFWIALRGDRPVGRISAQIDRESLARHRDDCGHFGLIEGEDDPETFAALTAVAEDWLRARGMARVRGPFSLSVNDESGLLVEGFEAPPMFMMGHARPYYAARLEQAGYAKAKDLLAYQSVVDNDLPDIGRRLLARVSQSRRVVIRPLERKRYDAEIRAVLDVFNDAWGDNWSFVPLTEAELDHLARELKPIIEEDLVAIAEVDGEPAAMMVALPNLNEAIADLSGRLLPFGWLKLLWRLKTHRLTTVRVPLMGVRRRWQGSLLGGAMMVIMFEMVNRAAYRRGIRRAELSWVLEDNLPMRHVAESFGAQVYKRYRVYEKPLASS